MGLIEHPLFSLELPSDWRWHPDEQGGGAVAPPPPAVLHVTAEAVEDRLALPNLSRMLAGFLTRQIRPVAADELVSMPFSQATGFGWQYVERSQRRPAHAWRVWIAGNEAAWAFLSFNCALEDAELHRPSVDAMVASLRLITPP